MERINRTDCERKNVGLEGERIEKKKNILKTRAIKADGKEISFIKKLLMGVNFEN